MKYFKLTSAKYLAILIRVVRLIIRESKRQNKKVKSVLDRFEMNKYKTNTEWNA